MIASILLGKQANPQMVFHASAALVFGPYDHIQWKKPMVLPYFLVTMKCNQLSSLLLVGSM
jgi:hypothetical protein